MYLLSLVPFASAQVPAFLLCDTEIRNMTDRLRNTNAPPAFMRGCETYTLTKGQENYLGNLQGVGRCRGKLLMVLKL